MLLFPMSRSSRTPVAAAVAFLLSAGAAVAQSTPVPAYDAEAPDAQAAEAAEAAAESSGEGATRADRRRALDRVTISAARKKLEGASTRLPLTARETPQSMSSLDASRLENETLISINDVMQNITGVNVSFYDTQDRKSVV